MHLRENFLMNISDYSLQIGQKAKKASRIIASAKPRKKNNVLIELAELLKSEQENIIAENAKDIENAKKNGMDSARLDRLTLTPKIIDEMAQACIDIANQAEIVGAADEEYKRPNNLLVSKVRVPLGVIAMIYESRPNVTIDAAALCIKAGNSVILRGGSEAVHSNICLANLFRQALEQNDLDQNIIQLVENTDRSIINELCKLNSYIDVMIPRGGEPLIKLVSELATMPVLKHDKGVCHIFIDESADLDKCTDIVENSKVQRPSACNSLECLLIHDKVAHIVPDLAKTLIYKNVELRVCPKCLDMLRSVPNIIASSEADYGVEFGDLTLVIKIVSSLDNAIEHISKYGSKHTEIILTNDLTNAKRFINEVDASLTGVNASTRFNDGGQLGLGAEIGISTSKLHAYGPMGVKELTTTKFVIMGDGQVR